MPGIEMRISPDGEIQVRGWSVMQGYCNNPEATAKAFTADGWLRTGDLGELTADGRLRMVGRLKDVFRVGGENVAPAEVEEVLLAHPAVRDGAGDRRARRAAGRSARCAYVTLKAGMSASEAGTARLVQGSAAPTSACPRYLRIVDDFEAIGMTASGKVQKTKLREHALKELKLS